MKDLKVALISSEFPPLTFGGVGSVCQNLAYTLSKNKIHTTVLCRGSRKIITEKLNDYLEIIRLPCLDFPPRSLWFQLQNFHRFSKLLMNQEVLHVISSSSGVLCVNFKKKWSKPLVTSFHGVMWRELHTFINSPISYWTIGDFAFSIAEYPLYDYLDKKIIENSDHVIACSFSLLEDLKNIYGNFISNKVSVIHNGINIEKIDRTCNGEKNIGQNDYSVVYYGRLFWRKGLIYLLKAIAKLKQDFPDIILKIFGTGPLMGKIKKQIFNLSLKENVCLMGYVAYDKLIKEIKKADVVVLPSLYEASPIAPLEAMACKKAPIVFDFPFSREFITNMYNGLLVEAKNEKDLSDKIRLLLTDKKLRTQLGRNAYDYVKKYHNWDELVKKYVSIYESLS